MTTLKLTPADLLSFHHAWSAYQIEKNKERDYDANWYNECRDAAYDEINRLSIPYDLVPELSQWVRDHFSALQGAIEPIEFEI